jgi:hypothetical protein
MIERVKNKTQQFGEVKWRRMKRLHIEKTGDPYVIGPTKRF